MILPPKQRAALDLKPYYFFVQVAEAGSFSRAACTLSVSQPILSREIKYLEELHGIQLFNRNGRGISLTPAGEQLLVHARSILRSLSLAQDELRALSGAQSGSVIVALPPLFGKALAIDLIQHCRREYQEIALSLIEAYSATAIEMLTNGVADIAVLYNSPSVSTLNVEHLMDDHFVLVGATGSLSHFDATEISLEHIAGLALALAPRPHRLRTALDHAAREADVRLTVALEVTGTGSLLELVREGIVFTILPFSIVRAQVEAGTLDVRRLSGPFLAPRLFVATSMQRPQTVATKVVLSVIRQQFRRSLRDHSWPPNAVLGRC
ncbi:LysR family transcriptional regulator [Bradyrhizobium liaoningense]|uniref:LysR family transcriptional regulator n=1 Tax=Bradyrhizobium liaoningense TaxID=43992 RepID=UPI001BA8BC4A|nr:LysR family transcriptional regulator [Bradyrhizobium liaoningense]MBR0713174.1 LysR family transcriptional regulator [Bradyrhizobium liaoningense]